MENNISFVQKEDLPFVFNLYEEAIAFIKEKGYIGWTTYDKVYLTTEAAENKLFKIVKADTIIGVFAICLSDPLIWRDREKGESLYLHRITVNRAHKNSAIFETVLQWSLAYINANGLKNIRMDTWAQNAKIIDYYKSYGFTVVENYKTPNTTALPEQHRNLNITLLEYDTNKG